MSTQGETAAGSTSGGKQRSSFLTAYIGSEEYALPLARVHEVIPCSGLTRVPTAPAFVRGLASLHGSAVPVVDLALRFGGVAGDESATRSVVVVYIQIREEPTLVGIVIDRLGRVLHVPAADIAPPPQLDSLVSVEFLTGVILRDGAFVLCVNVDRLLGADEVSQVAELAGQQAGKKVVEPKIARTPYLCVNLAGERCALGLGQLHEITLCGAIAPVPGTPPFVLGATNVRGSIVPVVDVAMRYGVGRTRVDGSSCLLLVDASGDGSVAIVVESIERLAQVPKDAVNTTPPFGARFPPQVVLGMAPVGDAFVPILDAERALADDHAPGGVSEVPVPAAG